MNERSPRLIAFYLPQFHPIAENDAWWGTGFTEWTNVAKATPLFSGHYQPQLPADLGFYDLRVPETRDLQASLAQKYGIYGFCYYHYWFHGKRLLERPFQDVLESGKPDFPFCLCWANENWTRRWDGQEHEVLMKQQYSEDDDLAHIQWLISAFQDNRYIKIHGKPLLLVYRVKKLPNPRRTFDLWRREVKKHDIPDLFLCSVESFLPEREHPANIGCDAASGFQMENFGLRIRQNTRWRWAAKLGYPEAVKSSRCHIYDYGTLVEKILALPRPDYTYFPSVVPAWDNSPRRKHDPAVYHNSTPELFERWLRGTLVKYSDRDPEERIVFINAWNEWAEGAHLEPCQKWGRAYLEATQRAVENSREMQENG